MTNFVILSMSILPTLRTWKRLMTDWFIPFLKHSNMSDAITEWVVCRVQSDGMTDKKQKLWKFTRCILMKLQH